MEAKEFDTERFDALRRDRNHLGAWMLVKGSGLERTEEAIHVGVLANDLVRDIADARARDDRERQAWGRSLLAYIVKDWPGLASLYREQIRPSSSPFVPDAMGELWQEFNDVMSGRKGFDESLRQRMEEARQRFAEGGSGAAGDPLRDFARDAEREIRKGFDEAGKFFESLFRPAAGAEPKAEAAPKEPKAQPDKAPEADGGDDAERVFKVRIQDADEPLPKDIHQAESESDK